MLEVLEVNLTAPIYSGLFSQYAHVMIILNNVILIIVKMNNIQNKVALIGSSGLTGSYLLHLLQEDNSFAEIRLIVRKAIDVQDTRASVHVVDFNNNNDLKQALSDIDIIFCAIGTTAKKVNGSKSIYRQIDYDIPLRVATIASENGCKHFLIVSSTGADSLSNSFYLKLKGELEEALRKISIPAVSIFRPSILLGKRNEFRLGETIGKTVMSALSFLIPDKYKPVHAKKLASFMVAKAKEHPTGYQIYLNEEINR